jgi:hypothetical protein
MQCMQIQSIIEKNQIFAQKYINFFKKLQFAQSIKLMLKYLVVKYIYIFAFMDTKVKIEVKKLEIEPEEKGFKRWLKSKQARKTLIATLIGGVAGFVYFYFAEGKNMDTMPVNDIFQNVFFGAFLGFFVTNSPCARNKC